jgi:hypothetical protein
VLKLLCEQNKAVWPTRYDEIVSHIACMGGVRSSYKILARKPVVKQLLWMLGHRWEDNVNMGLNTVGCLDVD